MQSFDRSPAIRASGLLRAAMSSRLDFEASPSGRWVRCERGEEVVYLIEDPWGDGCSVLTLGCESREVEHFLDPRVAVEAVVERTQLRSPVEFRSAKSGRRKEA